MQFLNSKIMYSLGCYLNFWIENEGNSCSLILIYLYIERKLDTHCLIAICVELKTMQNRHKFKYENEKARKFFLLFNKNIIIFLYIV